MTDWWLWLYVAAMAGGLLVFAAWRRNPCGVPEIEYRVAMAIPIWSGAWYAVLAAGGGQVRVGGHTLYWARYVDWLVTASLLLVALALTATHAHLRKPWSLVTQLVAVNVLMLLSGLAADLSGSERVRFSFFALGAVAMAVVYVLVWGPLRAVARGQPAGLAGVYREAALALSVIWLGYPVLWFLGPSGDGPLGSALDSGLFVALSIVSKVGWSLLDIGRLRALSRRHELPVA